MNLRDSVPFESQSDFRQLAAPFFIIGPAYAGKSEFALEVLSKDLKTAVIGTASLDVPGLAPRIGALKSLRPASWQHFEDLPELAELVATLAKSYEQILIDSLSQWLAGRILRASSQHDQVQLGAIMRHEAEHFIQVITEAKKHSRIVIVSTEFGSGVPPETWLARLLREQTGLFHQQVARASLSVVQLTSGIPMILKGS